MGLLTPSMNTRDLINGTKETNMIQVRYGVFETNSSSTHSLIIANDKEYKQLLNGDLLLDYNHFIARAEVIELILEAAKENEKEMIDFFNEVLDINVSKIDKETINSLSLEDLEYFCNEFLDDIHTYQGYMESEYFENYEEAYVSEHGDKIHIFGLFGRDG